MNSSNTSDWESILSKNPLDRQVISREILITSSTKELVEFYWTNRKRFSGIYRGFQPK